MDGSWVSEQWQPLQSRLDRACQIVAWERDGEISDRVRVSSRVNSSRERKRQVVGDGKEWEVITGAV